jgi:light-regulated signal transduction histidine kinase (bacteriophytochrome)
VLREEIAGKHKMDEIRAAADQLILAESDRTRDRSANVRVLGGWVLFGSIAWTAAVGLVLAYFSRRHLASLASRHEAALAEARRQAAGALSAAREVRALNEQLERRVAERTAALEAANAELEAFSYSVSHDLRAPLRHVAGFIQMLGRTAPPKLDEKERRYLDTIADAAQQAGRLIDDLLSFSRMTRAELQWTRVDTAALAREVQEELSRELGRREVRWRLGSLPEVRGDREMLRQVFLNLLSNAVKYTRDRSQAEIAVGSVQEDGRIVFFVQDNGVGFDMQYAHKLFGVFQRLHRSDEFEGTGIGLANVRRIVLRHGGEVWAQAELGRGAKFSFSLPLHVARDASEDEAVEPPARAPEAHA